MTRITTLTAAQAQGVAAPILKSLEAQMGKVFNFHGAVANSPAVLKAFMDYDQALSECGTLTPQEREAIALAVSQAAGSAYCLGAHTMVSEMIGMPRAEVAALRHCRSSDRRLNQLAVYAREVLDTKGSVADGDLEALREVGYNEGQLVEIHAQIVKIIWTTYFNKAFDVALDVPPAP